MEDDPMDGIQDGCSYEETQQEQGTEGSSNILIDFIKNWTRGAM